MVETQRRQFPLHGLAGLIIMLAGELLLISGSSIVGTYFTPLMWTGYIIFIDALIAMKKGASPLTSRRREFLLLLPISIASWYIFEGVNLLLGNWSYAGLPESTAGRWLGYAWSYATITPAIFVTAELVHTLLGSRLSGRRPLDISARTESIFFFAGIALFVLVLLVPSPWLCPVPWISVLLWFEAMNDRAGLGSFSNLFRSGDYGLFVSLLVAGAVCGLLWESWNYRALAKWHYHVPYLPGVKLFEMPVFGFLGFPPFALECFLIYRFMRFFTSVPLARDVLDVPWNPKLPGGSH